MTHFPLFLLFMASLKALFYSGAHVALSTRGYTLKF